MNKVINTSQMIHIAAEVILIGGITFYFKNQIKGLKEQVRDLKAKIEENHDIHTKHTNNLYDMMDQILKTIQPQNMQQNVQQIIKPIRIPINGDNSGYSNKSSGSSGLRHRGKSHSNSNTSNDDKHNNNHDDNDNNDDNDDKDNLTNPPSMASKDDDELDEQLKDEINEMNSLREYNDDNTDNINDLGNNDMRTNNDELPSKELINEDNNIIDIDTSNPSAIIQSSSTSQPPISFISQNITNNQPIAQVEAVFFVPPEVATVKKVKKRATKS